MIANWRDWIGLAAIGFLSTAGVILLDGALALVAAWMLGFTVATLLFGWMIGFDVHSLTWLWGAWGEEDTGEQLAKLGHEWFVVHDVASSYGNWDHIVVGPGGLFLVDTKRVTRAARVSNDALTSGRTRVPGSTFRGAAVGLREALKPMTPTCPWVQAVVAIWGEFDEGLREEGRVTYVAAAQLVSWIESQPRTLSVERYGAVSEGLTRLASAPAVPSALRESQSSVG